MSLSRRCKKPPFARAWNKYYCSCYFSLKVSLIQELEEGLEKLQSSVKQLVRIYCQAFHTDFKLDSRIDQPWGKFICWLCSLFICLFMFNQNFLRFCNLREVSNKYNFRKRRDASNQHFLPFPINVFHPLRKNFTLLYTLHQLLKTFPFRTGLEFQHVLKSKENEWALYVIGC